MQMLLLDPMAIFRRSPGSYARKETARHDHRHSCDHTLHHHGHHQYGAENQKSCIALVSIFNHLEKGQMDEIIAVTYSVSYKKGENIYRAGDQVDLDS